MILYDKHLILQERQQRKLNEWIADIEKENMYSDVDAFPSVSIEIRIAGLFYLFVLILRIFTAHRPTDG